MTRGAGEVVHRRTAVTCGHHAAALAVRRIGADGRGAVLRLRPMMMTMLVATLGLLPAARLKGRRSGRSCIDVSPSQRARGPRIERSI